MGAQEATAASERERLGRLVRETWVAWALEQTAPKPSWVAGWDDMRIGETVAADVLSRVPSAGDVLYAVTEMSESMFGDAIRDGVDKLLAEKLPAIEAAARAAERARILEIAGRLKEPHRQPGTGSLEYAVPLVLLRAELVPKAGSSS